MAITKNDTGVTWSASASASVSAGGTQTSDEVTIDASCFAASITFKADNSNGSPAADDIIYFRLLINGADPDGASSDEFDTAGHAPAIAVLDTSVEDPAQITVELPPAAVHAKGFKVYADGAEAGTTNSITVSSTVYEHRSA